jgi:hypothetical protein
MSMFRSDLPDMGPCVRCGAESDHQCFLTECAAEICAEHTSTCISCRMALCAEHAKKVWINGVVEELCPACVVAHKCAEWACDSGMVMSVEPHGEMFLDRTWYCAVCKADLTQRDLEAA